MSPDQIVRPEAPDIQTSCWPWPQLPEIWYDPRSGCTGQARCLSLHAKCVIADGRGALVTSANLTTVAQRRNLKAGLIVCSPPLLDRLIGYLHSLQPPAI